jgi:ATP-binding cassette subfamily B protein
MARVPESTPQVPPRTSARQAFDALWPPVWASRRRVSAALALLVLAKLVMVAVPLVLKLIVDALSEPMQPVAIPIFLLFGYAVLRFMGGLFGELRDLIFTPVAQQVVADFNARTFEHLHRLGPRFHGSRQTGALGRDVERGIGGIAFLLGVAVFTFVPTVIEILTATSIMALAFNGWFSALVLATLVAYAILTRMLTERRTVIQRNLNEIDSDASGRLVDSLLNYETVKFYTNEALEQRRLRDILQRRMDAAMANQRSLSALHISQSAVIAVGVGAVMLLAGREVATGQMSVGSLVLVNAYIIQICLPLSSLAFVFRQSKDALIDTERLFALLDKQPDIVDPPDVPALALERGALRFEGVNFGYDATRQILWNIDFTVPAGHTVALVGGSGSGKSTIARLLYRFYEADSGRILIDDQPIDSVSQRSLRDAIGIVPQDTALFNDTIAYNIAYGRPGASMSDVIDAARAARIHEFINALPAQYDTLVGERGVKLSGGERQRIAIARAILKNPPILIFDEATSALDTLAERAIQQELARLAADRTTLIIAHRLSTVVDADEILVLEQGRIVERGTHAALVEQGGMYAQMWKLQRQQSELAQTVRKPSRQPVNLVAVVAGVLDALRPAIEARDINVYTVMDSESHRVTADPSGLQQAVAELASNAIAVTPASGRIEVRLETVDGDAVLSVTDGRDAEGLDADVVAVDDADLPATVFDPLHIEALVTEQGGQFRHRPSGQGRSQTSVLRMPLRAVTAARAPTKERRRLQSLAGVRVMVVDDQPDVLQVVTAVLQVHGGAVEGLLTGQAALDHLRERPSSDWPDVLVCDLSLGDIDGYQVLQEVRRTESDRNTNLPDLMPAVALTGRTGPQHRMRALLAGFQVHLTKPVEPEALVTTIAGLAHGRPGRARPATAIPGGTAPALPHDPTAGVPLGGETRPHTTGAVDTDASTPGRSADGDGAPRAASPPDAGAVRPTAPPDASDPVANPPDEPGGPPR